MPVQWDLPRRQPAHTNTAGHGFFCGAIMPGEPHQGHPRAAIRSQLRVGPAMEGRDPGRAWQSSQRTGTGAGSASASLGPLPLTLALPASSLRLRASSCASMLRPGRSVPPALSRRQRRQRSVGHGRPGPLPARRRASRTSRGGAPRPLAAAHDA